MSKRLRYKIQHARVEEWAKAYKGKLFHALLCDPPYELGFMGKDWDKSGIVFKPDTWAALAEHLLPGAFGMAFASARGWHRLACAIEDAGLKIFPSVFGWVTGQGFPKATRIDTQADRWSKANEFWAEIREHLRKWQRRRGFNNKQLNAALGTAITGSGMAGHFTSTKKTKQSIPTKAQWLKLKAILRWPDCALDGAYAEIRDGAERPVIGKHPSPASEIYQAGKLSKDVNLTAPSTDLARAWAGHRYGLQALKPALEPIIVFQKPYEGKPVDSITRTGAGALNIEGGRIQSANPYTINTWDDGSKPFGNGAGHPYTGRQESGRWPANFALQHHPDCRRVGVKKVKTGTAVNRNRGGGKRTGYGGYDIPEDEPDASYAGADGMETQEAWECVESCPVRKLDEQSGQSVSPKPGSFQREKTSRGLKGGGFGQERASMRKRTNLEKPGYADNGGASRFFFNSDWSAEVEEGLLAADPAFYCAKAGRKERDAGLEAMPAKVRRITEGHGRGRINTSKKSDGGVRVNKPARNPHPTVKPIKLCRWLATLLLPPAAYAPQRLLVPFAGTGSEMIAAMQAGWEHVRGIECEKEYIEIARARLAHWSKKPVQETLFSKA